MNEYYIREADSCFRYLNFPGNDISILLIHACTERIYIRWAFIAGWRLWCNEAAGCTCWDRGTGRSLYGVGKSTGISDCCFQMCGGIPRCILILMGLSQNESFIQDIGTDLWVRKHILLVIYILRQPHCSNQRDNYLLQWLPISPELVSKPSKKSQIQEKQSHKQNQQYLIYQSVKMSLQIYIW